MTTGKPAEKRADFYPGSVAIKDNLAKDDLCFLTPFY